MLLLPSVVLMLPFLFLTPQEIKEREEEEVEENVEEEEEEKEEELIFS